VEQQAHCSNVLAPVAAVHIVIPALNEEAALPAVLAAIPASLAARVIVVDNGSTDRTAAVARAAGAEVVREDRRGYGSACLAGIAALGAMPGSDVIVFLDADGSTDAAELGRLVAPILDGTAELVLGSRTMSAASAAHVPAHARAGNALAVALVRLVTGARFTDLGPFRALRLGTLRRLALADRDFGWNIEMQIRAVRAGVPWREVAVRHSARAAGESKISGTIVGSVHAGCKILWTVARHAV
jgi:glycosyltransferase involved in cell wall biosynthesis